MHRVSASLRCTHGRDGAVALDVEQGKIYSVNVVGSRILELLQGGIDEEGIVDNISREFAVNRDIARADVRVFVQQLLEMKLIE